jgi:transketolase
LEPIRDSEGLARKVRGDVLRMAHSSGLSHVGSSLSCVDMVASLYSVMLRDFKVPILECEDLFLLSKGHATSTLYATLWELGCFPGDLVSDYGKDGKPLMSHVSSEVPGVSFSFGSLGHGPSVGLGSAWGQAANYQGAIRRTFVLVGDGELAEGAVWESLLLAKDLRISNLVLLVDLNGIQSLGSTPSSLSEDSLIAKLKAFDCQVRVADGHNHQELRDVLWEAGLSGNSPWVIVCRTIKGKGVSFMENKLLWHYKSPSDEELDRALSEVSDD